MKAFSLFILRLFGWRVLGGIPKDLKKFVVTVAPHTSWKDFFLGLAVRATLERKIYYLGKQELFDSPLGFFFRWTGGKPVDRKHKTGLVDQVVALYSSHTEFGIALAIEGTRRKVTDFKTGFYFIAKKAGVPVIPCLFDYEQKRVSFLTPFFPTYDTEKDLDDIWQLYAGVKGANPELSITGTRSPD